MTTNLVYVLLNFRTDTYLKMFRIYLESLKRFSDCSKFDLLILCDKEAYKDITAYPLPTSFRKVHFLHIPTDKTLKRALLRKMDIIKFTDLLKYDKVLYTDIDMIIQGDINRVFEMIEPMKPGFLYVTEEGDVDGKYWTLSAYKKNEIDAMKREGIKGFNTGLYMFRPSKDMIKHFKNVRKLGVSLKDKPYFYDQSLMNYYFNLNRLAIPSKKLKSVYIMFPDTRRIYKRAIILHIAGISRYEEKEQIMEKYLQKIIKSQHFSRIGS